MFLIKTTNTVNNCRDIKEGTRWLKSYFIKLSEVFIAAKQNVSQAVVSSVGGRT